MPGRKQPERREEDAGHACHTWSREQGIARAGSEASGLDVVGGHDEEKRREGRADFKKRSPISTRHG